MKRSQKRTIASAVITLGLVAGSTAAQAQNNSSTSDAQVESNVLKALASAPDLANQNIQTSTTFGVVTMTGNVHDDALRTKAENLVARAPGVKKVVDQMTLGDMPATAQNDANGPEMANMASGDEASQDQGGYPQQAQDNGAPPPVQPDQQYHQGYQGQAAPEPQQQPGYPQQGQYQDQGQQSGYAQAPPPPGYVNQPQPYGEQAPPPPDSGRRPMYGEAPPRPEGYPGYGQQAGLPVTVPAGAPLSIRVNRGIDSQHIKPGTPFTGMVMNDVVANGAVAIPRGATVSGVVVDAEKTKALSGQGQLALQIHSVVLGGQVYPLESDVWHRTGADKSASTVNHAIGLGALGAVVGAIAGGGAGAAIGAGVGGAAGVAASAGSPHGQVIVPPEAILNFHVAAPVTVRTLSEQEMQRLAYEAGPQPQPRGYYRRPYGYPPPPPPYPYGRVYYYGR